jgi:hypothetical protein
MSDYTVLRPRGPTGPNTRTERQPLAETAEWLQNELNTWTDAVMKQLTRLQTN